MFTIIKLLDKLQSPEIRSSRFLLSIQALPHFCHLPNFPLSIHKISAGHRIDQMKGLRSLPACQSIQDVQDMEGQSGDPPERGPTVVNVSRLLQTFHCGKPRFQINALGARWSEKASVVNGRQS